MKPTNKEVYARLIILKGLVAHAISTPIPMLPELYAKWSEKERLEFEQNDRKASETIIDHIKEMGAWKYTSPKEIKFFQSCADSIGIQEHINAVWRKECANIMMWALGLRESWPIIDQETPPEVIQSIPEQKIGLFTPIPSLRPHSELETKRALVEFWHWRVRTRRLIEEGRPFPLDDNMKKAGFHSYDDIVRFSAKAHYQEGNSSEVIDEDLAYNGKAFRSLSYDEYQIATSIIRERHSAMNWICGMAPGNRWDETPTDT